MWRVPKYWQKSQHLSISSQRQRQRESESPKDMDGEERAHAAGVISFTHHHQHSPLAANPRLYVLRACDTQKNSCKLNEHQSDALNWKFQSSSPIRCWHCRVRTAARPHSQTFRSVTVAECCPRMCAWCSWWITHSRTQRTRNTWLTHAE